MADKTIWQKVYPHLVSLGVIALLTVFYFFPLYQGQKLAQHDVTQAKGMMHEARTYDKYEGELTLWTNAMFGGMPTYQIWAPNYNNLTTYFFWGLKEIFPKEAHVFLLLFVGFYVLLISITRHPWISLVGAIAFGLSSFNLISLEAGHVNKTRTMALIAPILAGTILSLRKKYLIGAALMGIALAMQLRSNHYQITYYTMLCVAIIGIAYLIYYIRQNQINIPIKAVGFLALSAVLAVLTTSSKLWTTYEYAQDTIRGGKSALENVEDPSMKKEGLSYDYATRWSYGKLETFTLIIPNFYGGASTGELGQDSNLAEAGIPNQYLDRIPLYWGDQPFTSGPVYFGAAVCFLFFFSLFLKKSPLKWGLLGITILSIMLSWGSNFQILYNLFFNYMPYFNKFRTPSMILVLAQTAIPCIAALGLFDMYKSDLSKKELQKALKYSFFTTAGIVVMFGIMGSFFYEYQGQMDARLENSGWPIEALRADREDMLRMDAFRSLLFIVLAAAAVYGFIQNKIKAQWLFLGLGAVILIDLWMVDKRYLSNDDFVEEQGYQNEFAPSQADMQIINQEFNNNTQAQNLYQKYLQKEKQSSSGRISQLKQVDLKATAIRFSSNYRVLNLASNTFNESMTAYYHKSVGGYHAAKLRRYQELIERHISQRNRKVLNMLNTKYLIVQTEQGGRPQVRTNPDALGSVWFVANYELKENASAVMNSLNNFNPAKTALINKKYKEYLNGLKLQNDSQGKIELVEYQPNHLTYKSNSSQEQLAVFSETYYNDDKGWKAYIDGEQVEHIRVNYVLRGMRIPQGEHTIEFKFYPQSYYLGEKISLASSGILIIGFLGISFLEIRKSLQNTGKSKTKA